MMLTSAQVIKISATVTNNTPSQDYTLILTFKTIWKITKELSSKCTVGLQRENFESVTGVTQNMTVLVEYFNNYYW